jgi:hypothetical protein
MPYWSVPRCGAEAVSGVIVTHVAWGGGFESFGFCETHGPALCDDLEGDGFVPIGQVFRDGDDCGHDHANEGG